jgi:hypothetical protein
VQDYEIDKFDLRHEYFVPVSLHGPRDMACMAVAVLVLDSAQGVARIGCGQMRIERRPVQTHAAL